MLSLCDPCELFYYTDCPVNFIYYTNTWNRKLSLFFLCYNFFMPVIVTLKATIMFFSCNIEWDRLSITEMMLFLLCFWKVCLYWKLQYWKLDFLKNWNLICPNLVVERREFQQRGKRIYRFYFSLLNVSREDLNLWGWNVH